MAVVQITSGSIFGGIFHYPSYTVAENGAGSIMEGSFMCC
jgi:hypothetical protein